MRWMLLLAPSREIPVRSRASIAVETLPVFSRHSFAALTPVDKCFGLGPEANNTNGKVQGRKPLRSRMGAKSGGTSRGTHSMNETFRILEQKLKHLLLPVWEAVLHLNGFGICTTQNGRRLHGVQGHDVVHPIDLRDKAKREGEVWMDMDSPAADLYMQAVPCAAETCHQSGTGAPGCPALHKGVISQAACKDWLAQRQSARNRQCEPNEDECCEQAGTGLRRQGIEH